MQTAHAGGFDLAAIKSRNAVPDLARQWVRLRRRHGRFTHFGPCPLCSRDPQAADDARFECNAEAWVCAACSAGGDVIALVMHHDGLSFLQAVERLGGIRNDTTTPTMAHRAGAIAHRDGLPGKSPRDYAGNPELLAAWHRGFAEARQEAAAEAARIDSERRRLFAMWQTAMPGFGSPVEQYLRARGLELPDNAHLRFVADAPMFAAGGNGPVEVHRGPAMLAAITGAHGRFTGLHITFLDSSQPKGKARIIDPSTGEILPAKKVRGVKQGGHIELGGCRPQIARRMIAGEGIETTLAVYTARRRAGRDLAHTSFRCAIDLGNLAGRAASTIEHPTAKAATGHARRLPGPVPDVTAPAMAVPDQIEDLVLLGDGDSEPFTTRVAMRRAAARHRADGRKVRVVFAEADRDFDDMLTGKT